MSDMPLPVGSGQIKGPAAHMGNKDLVSTHAGHIPHIDRRLAKIVNEGRSDSQVILVSAATIVIDISLICQLISRLFEYSCYITNSEVSAFCK